MLIAAALARQGRDAQPLPGPPLRELAAKRGIAIGTAVRGTEQRDNRAYRELIAAQFSSVTPENEMKWYALEPDPGRFCLRLRRHGRRQRAGGRPAGARARARLVRPAALRSTASISGARQPARLPATFLDNMRRFEALGLEIHITEADVGLRLPVTEGKLRGRPASTSGSSATASR